jgi:hypothetical protein
MPIGKPLLILGAIVAALLLVQTIASPYQEQLAEARESAAIQAQQTQAAAESAEAAQERAARAQRTKEEATDAAQQTSDFDDAAPRSLVVFTQRLLGNG